jgi:hypothetical protein
MRITPGILLAILAMSVTGPIVAKDCALMRYASVDLEMLGDRALIPVMIENEPARMALNLQSAITGIWQPAAGEIGLVLKNLPANSKLYFGQTRLSQYTTVTDLTIGSLHLKGLHVLIAPDTRHSFQAADSAPIVGIAGMDFFAHVDFELDFGNKKLNLYSQDHCNQPPVYWTDTFASTPIKRGALGNAYFPMELEGKLIAAALDPDRSGISLTTDVTKRLYGFDEHSAGIDTEHNSKGRPSNYYRAMALTTPGLKITNARVELLHSDCRLDTGFGRNALAQHSDCVGAEAPLRLGMDVMRKIHWYFATKENVLYFTAADAAMPPVSASAPVAAP